LRILSDPIITVIMCILEKEFFDCAEEIVEEYFDALEQLGKILNKHIA